MDNQIRVKYEPVFKKKYGTTHLMPWMYHSFTLLLGLIILLSGCDSDDNSSGGITGGSGSYIFLACPTGRSPGPVPCTLEIDPVCGLHYDGSSRSYDNDCVACADLKVSGYWTGGCQTIVCTDPRPEACTREYVPVCGLFDNGKRRTMANACEACASERVVSYLKGGECL
jgi:hypothetical protein